MNEKTLKKMCKDLNLSFEKVVYNLGWDVSEVKLYKGEIFKPCWYIGNKPHYQYIAKYQITLCE